MLEVERLTAGYGSVPVLHEVSLTIPSGTIVTLLGPNGAGKSTTLRAIAGLLRPSSGRISFEAQELGRLPAHMVVRRGIALVPERRELFGTLSVRENLMLGAFIRNDRASVLADLDQVYQLFPRLRERRSQPAQTLSGGEQQMLAIGRGLMSRPRLLLLDEPSLGIAPQLIEEIFLRIAQIRATGTAILLVEQNAAAALDIADHAFVIEAGEIRLNGSAADLKSNPAVKDAYLSAADS